MLYPYHTYALALSLRESQSIGMQFGFPRLIKQLGKLGIDYRADRFMRSAVENVVLRELRLLKHKARIPVKRGVTLFGMHRLQTDTIRLRD